MKNRKRIIIFSILTSLVIFSIFYKWKQRQFLGLSEPKIESKSEIVDYANLHGIKGEVLVAKNEESLEVLEKYFPFGMIYILDEHQDLVDCNVEKLGGSCFQDIQNELCQNSDIKAKKFDEKISGKKVINKIIENTQTIYKNSSDNNTKIKYYVYYTWVKYAKASIDESSLKFIKCIENRNDVKLININTDMLEKY